MNLCRLGCSLCLFITITSFGMGWEARRRNKRLVKSASRSLGLVPAGTEESTVWVAPLSLSGLSWHPTSPRPVLSDICLETEAAIQTWSDESLVIPILVSPEQNEVTEYLGVSPLWLEQPSDRRLQNVSLYQSDSTETPSELDWLQCPFLFFCTEFYGQRVSLPAGNEVLWPRWAHRRLTLGFQTILAATAHDLAQNWTCRLFKAMEPKQGDLRRQWLNIAGSVHPI